MTPIFMLSADCAAPPMATASTAATMVPALIFLSLRFVALEPDSISRLHRLDSRSPGSMISRPDRGLDRSDARTCVRPSNGVGRRLGDEDSSNASPHHTWRFIRQVLVVLSLVTANRI